MLITDAQFKASLAVIRSLGKRNIRITAGSEIKSALGLFSKYCKKKIIYPNPRTNTAQFLKYIQNIVKKEDFDCIIPFHTYTTFLLYKYKDMFIDYTKIPPPDFNIFIKAYDKKRLLKIASTNNIYCPKTYFSDDINELKTQIKQYPIIIKPSIRHGVQIAKCKNSKELKENYTKMNDRYGPCIVQEYIPNGDELGVYTLFDYNSNPIALTVQKRVRTITNDGGISTYRVTVKNQNLVNISFKLLKKLKWSGVAMIEFRIDKRDGIPKLMEINPRFWGSLQLSIFSGVDFPYLLYNLIINKDIPSSLYFKDGVQCRWLVGDITSFFKCPNKIMTIGSYLKPNLNFDVISLKDTIPGLVSIFSPIRHSYDDEQREEEIETKNVLKNENLTNIS
ncbi:hypothetical protein AYK24_02925 [Thermoplasmatales archaeon SG8-52-4]|nr:MAG: hypothetical protein AYK24_02925 [Thermoplasmatales archaeon SG8-52-4]